MVQSSASAHRVSSCASPSPGGGPRAQARRHGDASGPRGEGVCPAAARSAGGPPVGAGLVGQGGQGSASIRASKRRASSPSRGDMRRAEGDPGRAAAQALAAPGQDAAGAVDVHGHHRPAGARGQVGGAAAELLEPAVGGAAPLGEDDEVPALLDERGGVSADGGSPGGARWGWPPGQGPQVRLPAAVEEVVGGGGHHRLVAEAWRGAPTAAARCRRGWRGWPRRWRGLRPELEDLVAPHLGRGHRRGRGGASRCRGSRPAPGGPGSAASTSVS